MSADLAALLAEHEDADYDTGNGTWRCTCGAVLDTAVEYSPGKGETPLDVAHRAHVAEAIAAAGWVHVDAPTSDAAVEEVAASLIFRTNEVEKVRRILRAALTAAAEAVRHG